MRLVSKKQARRRLTAGDRVNDHLIVRSVLGKGGSATVFEALHERLGSLVALKVMDVEPQYARDAAARLEREAQVCAAIDDPRIPKIYDVGRLKDGTPYIVMEKVSGRTLDELLDDGPLSAPAALAIVRELLNAMRAVHRVGVVHRDIKPANVIAQVAEDGVYRVRLMDFGVSKEICARVSNPAITHQGALVGTPHYMAPEQMSDEGVDERTDVYAAGVLLYELLAGRVPFDGESTAEVMAAVMRHSHVPLSTWCPDASPGLIGLVERAMSHRPADRFATAREMRDALDALNALDAPSTETLPPEPPSRPRTPSYPPVLAALSSIALAGVLALASRHFAQPQAAVAAGSQEVSQAHQGPRSRSQQADAAVTMPRPLAPAVVASEPANEPPPTARASRAPAPPAPVSRSPAKSEARGGIAVATKTTTLPISHGVLIADYAQQLHELERVVSGVAASLEGPGPLPANPYR